MTSDQFKAGLAEVRTEIAEVRTEIAALDTRLSTQIRLIRWMVGTVLATGWADLRDLILRFLG